MNKVWICSIDIGKKNFAFYIEEIDVSQLQSLKYIPEKQRYEIDGTSKPEFSQILKDVCVNGKNILFKNTDLTVGCNQKAYLDIETLHNLTDLLDEYIQYWDKCEVILIEKQMSFGKKVNTLALKIAQHCWSYFAFKYGRFKKLIEFPAYYKTQILGAQKIKKVYKTKISYKAIDKPARKKWTIEKAMDILAERNDFTTLSTLTSQRKKDDLADVICQLQAFKVLYYIDKSL